MRKFYKILLFVSCASLLFLIIWNTCFNYATGIIKYEPNLGKIEVNLSRNRLFDLQFEYMLNSNICVNTTEKYFAVFIVTSYITNVEIRNFMRRAFPNYALEKMKLRRVFLLGCDKGNQPISQAIVKNEADRFGDIIQGNFGEAYRNLTYKHIMGLNWVSEYCSNVKYVIKMDDDIVVDVRQLMKLLKTFNLPSQNYIIGYTLPANQPVREPNHKWYVTKEEFEFDWYPTFVSGWLYATTPQVVQQISTLAKTEKYFWIDDVFVTGVLAQKLKIRHLHINKYFATEDNQMQCCLRNLPDFRCSYLIGPNGGDLDMFYNFNVLTFKCLSKNTCSTRNTYKNRKCLVQKSGKLSTGKPIIIPYQFKNPSLKKHLSNVL